ncbi:Glucose-responsive transcription factor [Agyrium rufum]|nr:Glucose-responsive transcription factor [Agyrium rufum]
MSRSLYPSPTQVQLQADRAGPFFNSTPQGPPSEDHDLSMIAANNNASDEEHGNHTRIPKDNGRASSQEYTGQSMPSGQDASNFATSSTGGPLYHPVVHHHHNMMPIPTQRQAQEARMMAEAAAASVPDFQPSRKKPKVSRACDECRRKKIRCEFQSENVVPDQPVPLGERCSNCTRTNSTCEFSRMPQKRGPSKGYIKELADRLHSVEQLVTGPITQSPTDPHQSPTQMLNEMPHGNERSSTDMVMTQSYGNSMGGNTSNHTRYQPSQPILPKGYSNQMQSPTSYSQPPQTPYQQMPGSNNATPDSHYRNGHGLSKPMREDNGDPQNLSQPPDGVLEAQQILDQKEIVFTVDVVDWQNYVRHIHQTFPILQDPMSDLRRFMDKCLYALRGALCKAITIASDRRPLNATMNRNDNGAGMTVFNLMNDQVILPMASRNYSNNLIYLQTCLLMIIASDVVGPNQGIAGGPPRGAWFGMAYEVAQHMKLSELCKYQSQLADAAETKWNTLRSVAGRCWWTLIILDRWYAAGHATARQIKDSVARMGVLDSKVLGNGLYHLGRLSLAYGHIGEAFCSPMAGQIPQDDPEPLIYRVLDGEMSRTRESMDSVLGALPIVQLAYWHSRLLFARHAAPASRNLKDIVAYTSYIVDVIGNTGAVCLGPLTHHHIVLATMTLDDLLKVPSKREDVKELSERLLISLEQDRKIFPATSSDEVVCWGNWAIRKLRGIRTRAENPFLANENGGATGAGPSVPIPATGIGAQGDGLKQLAEMAAGASNDEPNGQGDRNERQVQSHAQERRAADVEWTALGANGYLNAING